jgi:hypothetical protein
MTPYELGILLHYYCRPVDHDDALRNPPIWRPTIQRFLDAELLRVVPEANRDASWPRAYEMTERGRVYCVALQNVPLPVWRMPAAVDLNIESRCLPPARYGSHVGEDV